MIFDFTEKGKVAINMIEYIKNIISDFPEEIDVSGGRSSFHSPRSDGSQAPTRRTGTRVPSHDCSVVVFEHKGSTRHITSNGISHN
jgi:hypothetical protein